MIENFYDKLTYNGNITVTIVDGDRLISTKTYHNNAAQKLFQFFIASLRGEFTAAKNTRPCRLVLFRRGDEETSASEINSTYWNDTYRVSTPVLYDTTIVKNNTNDCSVTYHFKIPYAQLTVGSKITKLGLYPNTISSFSNDLCAYRFLSTEEAITIEGGSGNFTLIVDWELVISNKN